MSTEYLPVAERLAAAAARGGLSVAELKEIVSAQYGEINCYPGEPGDHCHPLAVFVALHGQLRKVLPLGRTPTEGKSRQTTT